MRAWDAGVRWFTDLIEPPTENAVDLAYVRDQHLRSVNGTEEDARIERAIKAATGQAEHFMQRALMPQTWAMVLDRFPAWEIRLPRPPLIEVVSITYVDSDGVTQTMDGSPLPYRVVRETGPKARRSTVEPLYGTVWPTTRCQRDAVTITYRAGYVLRGSPEVADVPADVMEGIAMRAAEFYKQRSDSVMGVSVSPAIMTSRMLWSDFRVY